MADGDKTESKVIARLEYEQKFNLGNYQSESVKIMLEGPVEDIKDGKDLPRLLLYTATNMKKLTQKVHEGVEPRKYEEASEGVEVKKEGEKPPEPQKPPEVKKTDKPKEPEAPKKTEEKKIDDDDI